MCGMFVVLRFDDISRRSAKISKIHFNNEKCPSIVSKIVVVLISEEKKYSPNANTKSIAKLYSAKLDICLSQNIYL